MGWISALIIVVAVIVVIKLRHVDSDHGWREEAEGLRQRFERTGSVSALREPSGPGAVRGATPHAGPAPPLSQSMLAATGSGYRHCRPIRQPESTLRAPSRLVL
jgi:hypothetical protein